MENLKSACDCLTDGCFMTSIENVNRSRRLYYVSRRVCKSVNTSVELEDLEIGVEKPAVPILCPAKCAV